MNYSNILCLTVLLFFLSCIGDDFIFDEVEPTIRITNPIQSIGLNDSHQFEIKYFNNIGKEETIDNIIWTSSIPEAIIINNNGLATALGAGQSVVTAEFEIGGLVISDSNDIEVSDSTVTSLVVRTGVIKSTSSYSLQGSFKLTVVQGGLNLEIADDYMASTALPGLYVYLSNNSNSTSGALEVGAVKVFEGAHSYMLDNIGPNDYNFLLYYCKPFSVKVGDGKIN